MSMGSMKCGLVGSTMSVSTNVTLTNPSYISTTTSAILSHSSGESGINVQNTASGITLGSSNLSTSAQQSTRSSSKPEPSNGAGTPTLAFETNSISTGTNYRHAYE